MLSLIYIFFKTCIRVKLKFIILRHYTKKFDVTINDLKIKIKRKENIHEREVRNVLSIFCI